MYRKRAGRFLRWVLVAAVCGLAVACADDAGSEPTPLPENPFVKAAYSSVIFKPILQGNGESMVSFFYNTSEVNDHIFFLTADCNRNDYAALLQKHGDTGIDRPLTEQELDYLPHSLSIVRIQLRLRRTTENSGDSELLSEQDITDSPLSRIKFNSYATFIANDYHWPDGDNGPTYLMTLKDFNATAPHHLVDCRQIRLFYETYPADPAFHWHYLDITFADGTTYTSYI